MNRNFLHLALALIVALAWVAMTATAEEAKADGGMVILRGDQLTQSITTFNKGEFGPIKVVAKFWEDGFGVLDRSSRFQLSFDTYTHVTTGGPDFLQPIMVLDRKEPVGEDEEVLFKDQRPVYDWNTANECSLEKVMLVKKARTTYLLVADRLEDENGKEIVSLGDPAPQRITVYKFMYNPPQNERDRFSGYFLRISDQKAAKACAPKEVYHEMQSFAESTLR